MNKIFNIIIFLLAVNSFSQKNNKYSKNSEIDIFYNKSISKEKPTGVFINKIFVGNRDIIDVINKENVRNVDIEKLNFEKKGIEYYGKINIKMKRKHFPKFISLKQLTLKYLEINKNPIVFNVDGKFINKNHDEFLVDENFILTIIVTKVKTNEKNIQINYIHIVTKRTENIKRANNPKIILKG